jgi:hypothetical protein
MTKQEAMESFGCETLTQLADVLNVSLSAISQWTDPLPESAVIRVESALYRRKKRKVKKCPQ